MTREAKLLIDMWDTLHRECHKVVTEENYDTIKKSIKALEKEPILDKIRAEIEEQYKWLIDTRHTIYDIDIAFDSIFRFIDKYKAESEDKE